MPNAAQDWYDRGFVSSEFSNAKAEFDLMRAERDILFALLVDSLPEPVRDALGFLREGLKQEITKLAEAHMKEGAAFHRDAVNAAVESVAKRVDEDLQSSQPSKG